MLSMKIFKSLFCLGTSALLSSFIVTADSEIKEPAPAETKTGPAISEQESNTPKEAPTKEDQQKEEKAPTKEQTLTYFETLGWMTIMQSGLKNLAPSKEEKEAFLKGARLACDNKESTHKLGDIMEPMQKFFQKRAAESEKKHQEETKMIAEKNRKLGEDFLKKLKQEKAASVKSTPSGLVYEITKPGDDKIKASEEDSVEIFYTGKLIDGKVFDQSIEKTVTFPLKGVIPGFKEGLQLIGQGGKATLYMTDNLAYGEFDIPGIPAGSTLIFDVEVVKVVKAAKEEPAKETNEKTK